MKFKKLVDMTEKQRNIFQTVLAIIMTGLNLFCLIYGIDKTGFWQFAVCIPFFISLVIPKFLDERMGIPMKRYWRVILIGWVVCIVVVFLIGLISGQLFQ